MREHLRMTGIGKLPRSRDAVAPEFCKRRTGSGEWRMEKVLFASRIPLFATSSPDPIEGGGTPADALSIRACGRGFPPPNLSRLRGRHGGGLACRRSTTALAAASQRRSSAPERASWDSVGAHDPDGSKDRALLNGRYPLLPVPVQRPSRRPVIMPAGRLPEAARERR